MSSENIIEVKINEDRFELKTSEDDKVQSHIFFDDSEKTYKFKHENFSNDLSNQEAKDFLVYELSRALNHNKYNSLTLSFDDDQITYSLNDKSSDWKKEFKEAVSDTLEKFETLNKSPGSEIMLGNKKSVLAEAKESLMHM